MRVGGNGQSIGSIELSVADRGRLPLEVVHWATSVALLQVVKCRE